MKPSQVLVAAATAIALIGASGCSVLRDQQPVGSYIDDATITTQVKAKLADDPVVSAAAISVETLKGVVQLSGFAKTSSEKTTAEQIARNVEGVVSVKNDILVRS